MKSRVRFYIPLAIFVAWMGWLAFLAVTQTNKEIVSRSQVIKARAAVVVELTPEQIKENTPVSIQQIVWGDLSGIEVEKSIRIENLKKAKLPNGKDLTKPTKVLLLLTTTGEAGKYELAVAPRSPNLGPPPKDSKTLEYVWEGNPPIYTWSPEIEKQVVALKPQ